MPCSIFSKRWEGAEQWRELAVPVCVGGAGAACWDPSDHSSGTRGTGFSKSWVGSALSVYHHWQAHHWRSVASSRAGASPGTWCRGTSQEPQALQWEGHGVEHLLVNPSLTTVKNRCPPHFLLCPGSLLSICQDCQGWIRAVRADPGRRKEWAGAQEGKELDSAAN